MNRPAAPSLSPEQVRFIAGSPFAFVLSGGVEAAPDISPRGDGPGFVRVIGLDRLQMPDRLGNNRIDTIRNVLADLRASGAFAAGSFWDPPPVPEAAGLASLGHILADQVGGMTPEEADAFVANSYKNRLY